jgi:mannose-6-phosphate isomerase-like protein (cupin superfamily)
MDGSFRIEGTETVAAGRNYRIKRLDIAPGESLGEHLYRHRTEQFVVLSGEARIMRGEAVVRAAAEASVFIPVGMPHRIENPGDRTLSLLQIQVGSRFEEDDFQGA